jgi:hypothetical protein
MLFCRADSLCSVERVLKRRLSHLEVILLSNHEISPDMSAFRLGYCDFAKKIQENQTRARFAAAPRFPEAFGQQRRILAVEQH